MKEYTCRQAEKCNQAGKHQACTYSDGSRCEIDDPKELAPRVRFCWMCGAKLWGNKHKEYTDELGHVHIIHTTCNNPDRELRK